jgi:2',3'-cyclic-nucleotide 2'-phosphodiesterase (5'-nucleotidase family)
MAKKLSAVIFVLLSAWMSLAAQSPSIVKGAIINVDTAYCADVDVESIVKPYRDSMSVAMDRIIGFAPLQMVASKPESALSNLIADVVLWVVGDNGIGTYRVADVHLALMNIKGIRSSINEGNITIRDIYSVLPFENQIVIVGLKGNKVKELFRYMASQNGDGLAGGSFYLIDGGAEQLTVGGLPIDNNKVYGVAVNDYMANGGDGYKVLSENEWRVDTPIKLRDALIGYIERMTFANKEIVPNMQKRIIHGN